MDGCDSGLCSIVGVGIRSVHSVLGSTAKVLISYDFIYKYLMLKIHVVSISLSQDSLTVASYMLMAWMFVSASSRAGFYISHHVWSPGGLCVYLDLFCLASIFLNTVLNAHLRGVPRVKMEDVTPSPFTPS